MGNLEQHAQRELQRAGLFDKDSDYGGMLGNAVMDLVRTFAAQGHSGWSAHRTLALFARVAAFKTLTPITSDPAEWEKVEDNLWQNLRQSSCFSSDGGKTYHDAASADPKAIVTSEPKEAPP